MFADTYAAEACRAYLSERTHTVPFIVSPNTVAVTECPDVCRLPTWYFKTSVALKEKLKVAQDVKWLWFKTWQLWHSIPVIVSGKETVCVWRYSSNIELKRAVQLHGGNVCDGRGRLAVQGCYSTTSTPPSRRQETPLVSPPAAWCTTSDASPSAMWPVGPTGRWSRCKNLKRSVKRGMPLSGTQHQQSHCHWWPWTQDTLALKLLYETQ